MPTKKLTIHSALRAVLSEATKEDLSLLYQVRPIYRHLIGQLQSVLKAEDERCRENAGRRWGSLTPEQRRAQMAAAVMASPNNKPGKLFSAQDAKQLADARAARGKKLVA